MKRRPPFFRRCAAAVCFTALSVGVASRAAAQDDAAAATPAPADVRVKPSRANDPVVRALLESKPSTPSQLLQAVDTLLELGAIAEADELLKQLAGQQLDDEALASLAQQFGSSMLLKLTLAPDLQPAGKQFADAVRAAADRLARDPQRLADLIEQLKSPESAIRRGAMVRLRSGRDASIQALINALADAQQADSRPALRIALAAFGSDAVQPLLAVARSGSPELQAEAIAVLGRIGSSQVALHLLTPALLKQSEAAVRDAARSALKATLGRIPSPHEASTALERVARSYYDGRRTVEADLEGKAHAWRWDPQKPELASEHVSARAAALALAAELAADATELAPQGTAAQRLYLGALAEAAALAVGIDAPLPEGAGTAHAVLAGQDADVLERLLIESLETDHPIAATVAARLLGQTGQEELLYGRSPQPSALVQAARHPDRRLRTAALDAIFRLNPSKPYPGSSFVLDALGYLASGGGVPRALAADARPLEVQAAAGLLATIGYETEVATTDRQALSAALASPDYELALIDFSLASPTSGQLLEQFRRDNRTSRLPIGIVASSEDLDRAERLARRIPLTAVIIRTEHADALQYQTELMLQRFGRAFVPAELRRRQAERAVAWLAEASKAPPGLYNLRRVEPALITSLWDPELGSEAAPILARLGTPSSQRELVDLASFASQPLELRQAAAQGFAASVADFGALLTTAEIDKQYDRYNQSKSQDKESQQVLASILDLIEARAVADLAD
ncbi:MAG TPA: HEAT repeat domain-containing protein [Pirellulales bacterium]|nr:HEAT repeat domain-containing protein [Pirellulales bacterium]